MSGEKGEMELGRVKSICTPIIGTELLDLFTYDRELGKSIEQRRCKTHTTILRYGNNKARFEPEQWIDEHRASHILGTVPTLSIRGSESVRIIGRIKGIQRGEKEAFTTQLVNETFGESASDFIARADSS